MSTTLETAHARRERVMVARPELFDEQDVVYYNYDSEQWEHVLLDQVKVAPNSDLFALLEQADKTKKPEDHVKEVVRTSSRGDVHHCPRFEWSHPHSRKINWRSR